MLLLNLEYIIYSACGSTTDVNLFQLNSMIFLTPEKLAFIEDTCLKQKKKYMLYPSYYRGRRRNKDPWEFKNQYHIRVCISRKKIVILNRRVTKHTMFFIDFCRPQITKKEAWQTTTYDHSIKMENRKQLNNSIKIL